MHTNNIFIGIMSGTSLDGIDAIIADFSKSQPRLLATHHAQFPTRLREKLLHVLHTQKISLSDLGKVHTWLGECYAEAVAALLSQTKLSAKDISAIGNHGQTIFHQPHGPHPFTLQLGNQNVLAAKTGIPVVTDFRSLDIAYGGEGAPLAPLFHQALFADQKRNIGVLNIGGIANISLLQAGQLTAAFDTGPGNALIDAYMQAHFAEDYDEEGQQARMGCINSVLLNSLLKDDYFKATPPKSTGREYFNLDWLTTNLETVLPSSGDLKPKHTPSQLDILATLTELTAVSIAETIQAYTLDEVLMCGGGVFNTFLIERLQNHLPHIKLHNIAKTGIEPEWIEALAFAWLAKMRFAEHRFDLRKVTGSTQPVLLGQIILP